MKNKFYCLAYSVLDFGCDVRARHVFVKALSVPYAVEKLAQSLSCMYRNFRIARDVREVELEYDERF